jgi:signal transduction histidine kinase
MGNGDAGLQAGRGGPDQESHLVSLSTLSPELLSPFFHEFRTSLTMIKTCIALLTTPSVTYDATELREFMDIVRRGGDRVDRLVRDFLYILKLESGVANKEAHEAEPTEDISWAVNAVVRSLKIEVEERNVQVLVDVPDGVAPLPISDEHLQMIVEKLVHNAVKFSKPEGGHVAVRVRQENGTVRFEISDEGIGIPQEEQSRIFDQFYQLTRSGSERQGAGLGLAVARGLVELYGGTIRVQSQVDVGSTFFFVLPLARQAVETAPVEEPPPSPSAPAPAGEPPMTAEEAFRRLGITFGEAQEKQEGEEKKEEPPSSADDKDRGFFGWRRK